MRATGQRSGRSGQIIGNAVEHLLGDVAVTLIDALDLVEARLTGHAVLLAVPGGRSGYPVVLP